jgi:hypothetical protein
MNVTVLQENDKMWIAADSYPLVAFNKDKKKFQESAQLFFPIDDKIIFCSGNREVINNIMLDYMISFDRSIEELSNIARGFLCEWAKKLPDNIQGGVVEIMVSTAVNGEVVVYCIYPNNNFEPVKVVVEAGKRSVWSTGEKSGEATLTTLSLINQNIPMHQLFPTVFHSLRCAEVGGVLTVYQIDKFGTCLYLRIPIQDDNESNLNERGLQ